MRGARLKLPAAEGTAYYHCLSRVVDRRFAFGAVEKEQFVEFLLEYAGFCGVWVLTYCVMSNHFHVLVEVPRQRDPPLSTEEVLDRLEGLSGTAIPVAKARQMVEMFRRAQDAKGEARYLEQFRARMGDVSWFMKLVKQRFTQWYNRQQSRAGTLWEDRFKSVVVEGEAALGAMAAYIDLNPVRAGVVGDPKDYRWCGYGAAVGGRRGAKEGLRRVMALARGGEPSRSRALREYRMLLFGQGEEREGLDENGEPMRRGFSRAEVLEVLRKKGRLEVSEYVRCRVRYFTDGAVLGSAEFVDGVFERFRDRFGVGRRTGARRMRGLEEDMYVLRDLQAEVFG